MRLLEQVNRVGRQMRLADRTIEAYSYWIHRGQAGTGAAVSKWRGTSGKTTTDGHGSSFHTSHTSRFSMIPCASRLRFAVILRSDSARAGVSVQISALARGIAFALCRTGTRLGALVWAWWGHAVRGDNNNGPVTDGSRTTISRRRPAVTGCGM
jgi:hypothetical protein